MGWPGPATRSGGRRPRPLGLPLTAAQLPELVKRCRQAPYGNGEKTLVDTSVCRVWQLGPDRFSPTNPDWQSYLTTTVQAVQRELGLEKQKLDTHLYDLLLYESGGFFLPHRDGEKLDRMVATLVIVLPSAFEGRDRRPQPPVSDRLCSAGARPRGERLTVCQLLADGSRSTSRRRANPSHGGSRRAAVSWRR